MAVLLLSAVVLLLLVGGLPWRGDPGVYRSGVMLLLGAVCAFACLRCALRQAAGRRTRFVIGLCLLLSAGAVVQGMYLFGSRAIDTAWRGGAPRISAVSSVCLAAVAVSGAASLGYFAFCALRKGLFVAGIHVCILLLICGVYIDFIAGQTDIVTADVGGDAVAQSARFPFSLRVTRFEQDYYEDTAPHYVLLQHDGRQWHHLADLRPTNGILRCGTESVPLSALSPYPGEPAQKYFFLPGRPSRMVLRPAPPVRGYRAVCIVQKNRDALLPGERLQEEILSVNHPITAEGRQVYLLNARAGGRQVTLLLRYAPGRPLFFAGALGALFCTVGWAFSSRRRREEVTP